MKYLRYNTMWRDMEYARIKNMLNNFKNDVKWLRRVTMDIKLHIGCELNENL